jgi:hypothetical protein
MKNLLIFLLVLSLVGLLVFFMLQQSGVFDDLMNGGNNSANEEVVFEEDTTQDTGMEGGGSEIPDTNNSGSEGMDSGTDQSGSEGVVVNNSLIEEDDSDLPEGQGKYNTDAESLPNTALISDEVDRLLLGLAVLLGGFVLIRSNIIGKLFFPESTGYIHVNLFSGGSDSLSKLDKIKKNIEEKIE